MHAEKVITPNIDVVCGYYVDNNKEVEKGPLYDDYKCVVNEFSFGDNTAFEMININNNSLSINTHSNNSNRYLNHNVAKQRKINVTTNDINTGSTEIMLNFTDKNLVIWNRFNIPQLLTPLDNNILKEKYKGYLLILNIHRISTPKIATDVYAIDKNYIKTLLDRQVYKNNINDKLYEYNLVLEFADSMWNKINIIDSNYYSNTIKIVTMCKINGDIFDAKDNNNESINSIYVRNKGIIISKDNIYKYKENPSIDNVANYSNINNHVIPNSKFIYLIDKDNKLSDRYFYNINKAEKIVKLKEKGNIPDGLYIIKYNSNNDVDIVNMYNIEEIDNLDFIFKSIEEAENGANKHIILENELKEKELIIRKELTEIKAQYEKAKIESEKRRQELEEEKRRQELRYEKEIHKLNKRIKKYNANQDIRVQNNKERYEISKYQRDESLDKLKYGIGIASAIGAVYLLYNKYYK